MNPDEYGVMYRVEDEHWWYRGLREMIRGALRDYGPAVPFSLLDIGCGTGAALSRFGTAGRAVGIDISSAALSFAQRRGIRTLGNASALALPFPDESFDCVLMMDVLYHRGVPDKEAALREARRVLKPGGTFIVNVPAYEWLRGAHDRAVHTDKRFTRGELRGLLLRAGLSPTRLTYWNTLLFPAIALVRMIRREGSDSDLAEEGRGLSSKIFGTVLGFERLLLRIAPLPFGVSVFGVARARSNSL